MKDKKLSDVAWERILNAKNIELDRATFPIELSMKELETLGGRQPRLMLSMDERSKWPEVLRQHRVFPLSVSKTRLALIRGDPYHDFPAVKTAPVSYEARLPIRFVSDMLGQGENAHIMRLHTAGFLQHFLGGPLLYAVNSGKRHSPEFSFYVESQEVRIRGVQYEIDGQYESKDELVPIEMKATPYATCAIKQVYMPFRSLGEETGWDKPVRPLYITYDSAAEAYVVREVGFRRPDVWESIEVTKAENVRLKITKPPPKLLNLSVQLLDSNRVPQADCAYRIQELPGAVKRGISNAKLVAAAFRFDVRQSSYYRDAAEMLGFIKTEARSYVLTPDGRRFADRPPQKQADELAARMCRLPAVNAVLVELERLGELGMAIDDLDGIVERHAKDHNEQATGKTIERRAQTIRAWLKFIGSRTGAIVSTHGRLYLRGNVQRLDQFEL